MSMIWSYGSRGRRGADVRHRAGGMNKIHSAYRNVVTQTRLRRSPPINPKGHQTENIKGKDAKRAEMIQEKHLHQPIEVCQGSDCFGSGGGAAIVEIEELVVLLRSDLDNTNKNTTTTTVVAGGCRNFCSMGPNVHYNGHHFTKVKSVSDCRVVVNHILGRSGDEDSRSASSVPTIAERMAIQKADRARWSFLRGLARAKKSCRNREKILARLRIELANAISIEVSAARDDPSKLEQSRRRKERFSEILSDLHLKSEDQSSSDESSDEEMK